MVDCQPRERVNDIPSASVLRKVCLGWHGLCSVLLTPGATHPRIDLAHVKFLSPWHFGDDLLHRLLYIISIFSR